MEKLTKAETAARKLNAIETVKRMAPEGSRIAYVDMSYARSGASRRTAFVVMAPEFGFYRLDNALARACGYPRPKNGEGVLLQGGGMDLGLQAIENLSYAVYGHSDAFTADRL